MSGEKVKSPDERAFAVISTPRSLQRAKDQVTVVTDVVDKRQTDRAAELKPSMKVKPTGIRVTQPDRSITAGQALSRGQGGELPVQTGKQQEQLVVKVDQKAAESSKSAEPAVPVSRTDPAHLHKLLSQRIEQCLSSKQEESTTTTTTSTATMHEQRTQYSKTPVSVESTTTSTTDGVAQKEGGVQRARLKSETAETLSMEQRKLHEAVEKTRADVRQVISDVKFREIIYRPLKIS